MAAANSDIATRLVSRLPTCNEMVMVRRQRWCELILGGVRSVGYRDDRMRVLVSMVVRFDACNLVPKSPKRVVEFPF